MINIIGLGPGSKDSLTIGTIEVLKSNKPIFLRTEIHPTIKYLKDMGINFETYDHCYDEYDSFDEVYLNIAKDLVEKYKELGDLVYGVPGHPLVAEKSVSLLVEMCEKEGIQYKIHTAVSFVDVIMETLNIDPVGGLKIIDAFDMDNQIVDTRVGTIITQVYDNMIASEVKFNLSKFYDDEKEIIFVRAAGVEGIESIRKIPLYQLDWQEDIDYLTSIYKPKDDSGKYFDFYHLTRILETLRGENGCPWDREQTHESIKNGLVEECYEVIEAINNQDDDNLVEELGDVLLHVVFHGTIGKEEGYFSEHDIIRGICEKMIYRHPHVFKNEGDTTTEQVVEEWETLKKKEKGYTSITDSMNNIAKSLPATIRAAKVQKKAAKVGFDWDSIEPAFDKVIEELNEIKEVYKNAEVSRILEEVGDLLFSAINVARFLHVDGEEALNTTISKFIERFSYIEKYAIDNGVELSDMTLAEMDELWNESKKINKI